MRIYHKTAMKLWYYRNHRGSTRKNNNHTSNETKSYYAPAPTATSQVVPSFEKPKISPIETQSSNITLESFDMLTGVQFKDLIERCFKKNGYSVNKISPRINSIDFLIEKDNVVTAIATKHTFDLIQRSYVGNVIESAKMCDNVSKIMIITTSMYFVPQAKQLADEYGIMLWDREKLKTNLGGLK